MKVVLEVTHFWRSIYEPLTERSWPNQTLKHCRLIRDGSVSSTRPFGDSLQPSDDTFVSKVLLFVNPPAAFTLLLNCAHSRSEEDTGPGVSNRTVMIC